MPGKGYFSFIAKLQELLLAVGIFILIALPITLAYFPSLISSAFYAYMFNVSLVTVFLVMIIRPLADLIPGLSWLRPLVILRKGLGVFSASIIVGIMLSKFMVSGFGYLAVFFSASHWSLSGWTFLAPLGDLSALILLVTSNKYSKRALGRNWKRIQRLSYVYFYSGALYEYFVLGQGYALYAAVIVAVLVLAAFVRNRVRRRSLAPV